MAKGILNFIIFCIAFANATTIFGQRGIIVESQATPIQLGKKYFIGIGIDQYSNWTILENAKNDIVGIEQLLINDFGFESIINPLFNENATKTAIQNLIQHQLPQKLETNDQLIVYFAGHGYVEEKKIGNIKKLTGYLIPADASPLEEKAHTSFIQIDDFLKQISELPAFHISVILDACHGGIALKNSIDLIKTRGGADDFQEITGKMSRNIIVSAGWDEVAYDSGSIKNHSLFSGLLIRGMQNNNADINSDGYITLSELVMHLQNECRIRGVNQFPRNGSWSQYHAGGEMVFVNEGTSIQHSTEFKNHLSEQKGQTFTILPFRDLTGLEDPTLGQYISNFAVDIIENNLNHIPGVRVINPLVFNDILKNEGSSDLELIKLTKADIYLTGTYIKENDNIVTNVKLVSADDLSTLAILPPVYAPLDQPKILAKRVASIILIYLSDQSNELLNLEINPPDFEAYKLFKKALSMENPFNYGDTRRNEIIQIKKDLYEAAIELDSLFVRPYMEIAYEYIPDLIRARKIAGKLKTQRNKLSNYDRFLCDFLEAELDPDYEMCYELIKKSYLKYEDQFSLRNLMIYGKLSKNHELPKVIFDDLDHAQLNADDPKQFQYNLLQRINMSLVDMDNNPKVKEYVDQIDKNYIKALYHIMLDESISSFDQLQDFVTLHNELDLPRIWQNFAFAFSLKEKENQSQEIYQKLIKDYDENAELSLMKHYSASAYFLDQDEMVIELYEQHWERLISRIKWDFSYQDIFYINDCIRFSIYPLIVSKKKRNKKINKQILQFFEKAREGNVHYGYYYMSMYHCQTGNFDKAQKDLLKAYRLGWGGGALSYDQHPLLAPYKNHKKLKDFFRNRK